MAGSRSEVVRSPFKDLIDECLQSGWTGTSIHRHLCRTYGPGYPHVLTANELWTRYHIPSIKSITRYREVWLPTAKVLPESLISKKLEGLDVQIDTVQELARLLPLLRERAASALNIEGTLNGMLLLTTDRAVETFTNVWAKYVQHAFDLGLLKRAAVNVISSMPLDGADGVDTPLTADGELDFDAMPTEILERIIRGESRVRVTRIQQGEPLRARPRRGRDRAEGGTGTGSAGAGETTPD